jgi:hypothetical protein
MHDYPRRIDFEIREYTHSITIEYEFQDSSPSMHSRVGKIPAAGSMVHRTVVDVGPRRRADWQKYKKYYFIGTRCVTGIGSMAESDCSGARRDGVSRLPTCAGSPRWPVGHTGSA